MHLRPAVSPPCMLIPFGQAVPMYFGTFGAALKGERGRRGRAYDDSEGVDSEALCALKAWRHTLCCVCCVSRASVIIITNF